MRLLPLDMINRFIESRGKYMYKEFIIICLHHRYCLNWLDLINNFNYKIYIYLKITYNNIYNTYTIIYTIYNSIEIFFYTIINIITHKNLIYYYF